ncbi:MAG: hypothetical protein ACTHOM_15660 [Allomuricauda sp.]
MIKNKHSLIVSIFCLLLFACKKSALEDCDCQKMTVWSIDCDILFPVNITKENITNSPKKEITNKRTQDSIIKAILKLTPIEHGDGIDNRFLIRIQCKNSKTIDIESNCSLTMVDQKYYKTSEDLVRLVEQNLINPDSEE